MTIPVPDRNSLELERAVFRSAFGKTSLLPKADKSKLRETFLI